MISGKIDKIVSAGILLIIIAYLILIGSALCIWIFKTETGKDVWNLLQFP